MSDLIDIDSLISKYKEVCELRDALLRLKSNSDFNKVITEGYLNKQVVKMTMALVDDDSLYSKLFAISQFNDYLSSIINAGEVADKDLIAAKQMIEEMANE